MDACKECRNTTVWNTLDLKLRLACLGLQESVSTNCCIFVHPNLARKIVFVFHLDDVVKEKIGPVAQMDDTLHTRYQTMYDPDSNHNEHSVFLMLSCLFLTFGSNTRRNVPTVMTYTNQMARDFQTESYKNKKLLTKGGAVGTASQSVNTGMCHEFC